MQTPEWVSPALYGAAGGAIALAIVGFTWGGWVTGGTARTMAEDASTTAVASILTPYCLASSQNDPQAAKVLAELESASSYSRRTIVADAGWATPLGAEEPNRDLAQACEQALASM